MSKYNDHGSRFHIKEVERLILHDVFRHFLLYYPCRAATLLDHIWETTLRYRKIETTWKPEKVTPLQGNYRRLAFYRLKSEGLIFKIKEQVLLNIPGMIQWCMQELYIPENDINRLTQVLALQALFSKLWNEEGLPMLGIKKKKPKHEFVLGSIQTKEDLDTMTKEVQAKTAAREAAKLAQGDIKETAKKLDALCATARGKKPGSVPKGAVSKLIGLTKRFIEDRKLGIEPFNPDTSGKIAGQLRNFIFEVISQNQRPTAVMYYVVKYWRDVRAESRKDPSYFSFQWFLNNKSDVLEKTKRYHAIWKGKVVRLKKKEA